MNDEELDEFIDDARRKAEHNDDWWNMDFYDEAIQVAEELKTWRKADASTDG